MTNPLTIQHLIAVISAAAPITDISVGTIGVSSSVRIGFQASATAQQIANANTILTNFDWSDAATQAWIASQQNPNLTTLINQAVNAIQNNQTFLGLGTPTNAQAVQQVQALTQQINQIIKVLANILT